MKPLKLLWHHIFSNVTKLSQKKFKEELGKKSTIYKKPIVIGSSKFIDKDTHDISTSQSLIKQDCQSAIHKGFEEEYTEDYKTAQASIDPRYVEPARRFPIPNQPMLFTNSRSNDYSLNNPPKRNFKANFPNYKLSEV